VFKKPGGGIAEPRIRETLCAGLSGRRVKSVVIGPRGTAGVGGRSLADRLRRSCCMRDDSGKSMGSALVYSLFRPAQFFLSFFPTIQNLANRPVRRKPWLRGCRPCDESRGRMPAAATSRSRGGEAAPHRRAGLRKPGRSPAPWLGTSPGQGAWRWPTTHRAAGRPEGGIPSVDVQVEAKPTARNAGKLGGPEMLDFDEASEADCLPS
jgi:hypothetical protein